MTVLTHVRDVPGAERRFRVSPDRPLALLAKCPVYVATPMPAQPDLAHEIGIGSLHVKNEAERMRLGSFKALGGAFAVAQMICDTANVADPTEAGDVAADMTFVTASAGNHGLSVAAGARVFGAKAVVVLPETAPKVFARRIRATGAKVVAGGSYDESVADAIRLAETNGWLHLADGSWPGYEERPAMIIEGYTVLAEECRAEFERAGEWPTHVFLQAGVGGLAAAVAAHIRETWPRQPQITVVEPDRAPCLQNSIRAGHLEIGDGADSNMGRLDCKNASLIAFEALQRDADVFLTITDEEADHAVALMARHDMATTPSGAAGLAGLVALAPGAECHALVIVSEGVEDV